MTFENFVVVGREEARREPPLPDLLQGIGPGGDSRTVLMDRSGDRKRPREGLLSRSKREELRKSALERRVVVEEDEEEVLQLPNNRKRKGSIKDRLDWSDKVVVVEEEQEAETFIENKESLASLEKNYAKKLARPRMGMVADMVEAEKRVPATQRLHGARAPLVKEVIKRKVANKEPNIKKTLVNVNLKKEDNVNIVVMEEDVDDDEDEADFLGGRRIEERVPVEMKRGLVAEEEDLRARLGRSREEASGSLRGSSKSGRRDSTEDDGPKMDLSMIVKTVVRSEEELKEDAEEGMEVVDPEKEKYIEKERMLAKQRLMEKELLREERRLEMKERELEREKFREREIERLKEKERSLERKRLELREKELSKVKERERRKEEERRRMKEEREKALLDAAEEKRRGEEEAAAKERIRKLQLEEEAKRREVENLKAEKQREEKEKLAIEKQRAEAKRALQEERVRDELKKIDEQTGGQKGKGNNRSLSAEEKQIQILKEKEERLRERLRRERARKQAVKERRRRGESGSDSRSSSSSSSSSSSGSESSSESSEEDSEEERRRDRRRQGGAADLGRREKARSGRRDSDRRSDRDRRGGRSDDRGGRRRDQQHDDERRRGKVSSDNGRTKTSSSSKLSATSSKHSAGQRAEEVKHPERAKSEAGELKSKLENYLKRAKEAKEGKKK